MYYLIGNGDELRQHYVVDGSFGDVVYGLRRIDAMDVDVVNRVVYYLDASLGMIKVSVMLSLDMKEGCFVTE